MCSKQASARTRHDRTCATRYGSSFFFHAKQKVQPFGWASCFGRGSRTRTYDTWFWRPVLYQLSYTPLKGPVYYTRDSADPALLKQGKICYTYSNGKVSD